MNRHTKPRPTVCAVCEEAIQPRDPCKHTKDGWKHARCLNGSVARRMQRNRHMTGFTQ